MMYFALYFATVAACITLDQTTGIRRPLLLVCLPMLAMDCFLNMVPMGQSWRNTMSGELWNHRDHPVWGKVRKAVDRIFFWQQDHCRNQCLKEAAHGGFWPAYAADWRGSK